jgi:hypothetical protein
VNRVLALDPAGQRAYGEVDFVEASYDIAKSSSGHYQRRAAAPPSPTPAYVNPRTGAISEIPVGIDPGFAHNPGIAGIKYAAEQSLAEKLAAAAPEVARAVENLKERKPK